MLWESVLRGLDGLKSDLSLQSSKAVLPTHGKLRNQEKDHTLLQMSGQRKLACIPLQIYEMRGGKGRERGKRGKDKGEKGKRGKGKGEKGKSDSRKTAGLKCKKTSLIAKL